MSYREVPDLERLGRLLKGLREAVGMTQRDLARNAELSA